MSAGISRVEPTPRKGRRSAKSGPRAKSRLSLMFNVGMAVRSSGRRRGVALVSIAVFAISMSLAIPGMVSSAGANIANPGNVGV